MKFFHVTADEFLDKILEEGISPQEFSQWKGRAGQEIKTAGYIYAFSSMDDAVRWALRLGWQLSESLGTKLHFMETYIVVFEDEEENWEPDPHWENMTGNWMRSASKVEPSQIIDVINVGEERKELIRSMPGRPSPLEYEEYLEGVGVKWNPPKPRIRKHYQTFDSDEEGEAMLILGSHWKGPEDPDIRRNPEPDIRSEITRALRVTRLWLKNNGWTVGEISHSPISPSSYYAAEFRTGSPEHRIIEAKIRVSNHLLPGRERFFYSDLIVGTDPRENDIATANFLEELTEYGELRS